MTSNSGSSSHDGATAAAAAAADDSDGQMSPQQRQQQLRRQTLVNPQRPEALTGSFLSMIDRPSLHVITVSQTEMLERFERANHMLSNFNELSLGRFRQLSGEFRQHQQTLDELRKDLELVFKRINNIKRLTERAYPEHYAASVAAVGELVPLSQAASEHDLASNTTTQSAANQ
ncbi:hypothetical protein BOX15_Mlig025748g5 [Macrostomum lignano]|uniref:KxDL domain-containing protein n=1 Tax=Macrostomum lignano TaxID=282301 RepID=A0A267EZI7_9PLAT|nr:hypothetical protein BOX15_Mlig025748g5 [Macrostomum lignano]